nr:nucleoside hydrolase-like domain-containing protein [Kineosporia babensis]
MPGTAVASIAPSTADRSGQDRQGRQNQQVKPRIIITQDGEVDDMDSFIRWLYYANEFDTAGIILTSSRFHWAGNGDDVQPYRWTGTEWVNDYIDRYAKIYPNLRKHADGYPSPAKLRSLYKIGNISNVGEMTEVTEGSELIRKTILDKDRRTLNIQAWGGTNATARALKSIQEQYQGTKAWPRIQREVSQKVVIYNILTQDSTLADYIKPNWPDIKIIDNQSQFWSFAYAWTSTVPAPLQDVLKAPYMEKYLLNGHGPLLEQYRTYRDGKPTPGDDENNRWRPESNLNYAVHDFISEGDSPAFMYLFDCNGLRSSEDPTWGGWGGRFTPNATGWLDTTDVSPYGSPPRSYPLIRWVREIQNDFAARADWGITPSYRKANHVPEGSVKQGVDLKARPGQSIRLDGHGSDPDGDKLTYRWWQYTDADTFDGTVEIKGAETKSARFTVPADAPTGSTIHVILEIEDDGTPALKHYQRAVVTVR